MDEQRVKKGTVGEQVVSDAFERLGYHVDVVSGASVYRKGKQIYGPIDLNVCSKGSSYAVQVKHKEPRTYYPDTGMELWRYNGLKEREKVSGIPCLVLFMDDGTITWDTDFGNPRIYGEWLKNLNGCISPFGSKNNVDNVTMIYFSLDKLKKLGSLVP